jgi:hypothetical protein
MAKVQLIASAVENSKDLQRNLKDSNPYEYFPLRCLICRMIMYFLHHPSLTDFVPVKSLNINY